MVKILPFIILLLIIFGAIGAVIYVMIKKTDPKNQDSSESEGIKSAQEFLPFEDIRENMIVLPNQCYRAVLDCSSINYQLKTPEEREQIEMSFQRFLNTISFPITFFLQTKTIDNSRRLRMLDDDIKASVLEYPGIKAYADQYRRDMEDLNGHIGNSHQKKRYIIVTYDEVSLLDNLSPEEQAHYAAKEIRNRCNSIASNLESVGVTARPMNNKELVELIYSCYYRDDFSYSEAIASGDAFALFVDGDKDLFANLPKSDLARLLCKETANRIRLENLETTEEGSKLLTFIKNMENEEDLS